MKHIGLFEGIGGFSYAAHLMGWETLAWCEWNPFGQTVLKYHFPNAEAFDDITKSDFTKYANKIDILTGGFPCQPYSLAGKRKGKEDERHLWPEMLRAIREIRPRWVVGENVLGLVNWSGGLVFHEVQTDLEAQGYEVFPYVLPACAVNAPHRRDRVWFVAYRNDSRLQEERAEQQTARFEQHRELGGITPDAKSDGGSIGELGKQKPGQQIQTGRYFNGFENLGTTPDSGSTRSQGSGIDGQTEEYFGAQRSCEQRIAPDSESQSSERVRFEQREHCEPQQRQFGGDSRGMGNERINPDPASGRGRQNYGQGKSRLNDKEDTRGNWKNFPTQSPVCNGDDGLSARLDGITFSKWRNESIKAGGNAIVPQVVFQIYKAIEQYETLTHGND